MDGILTQLTENGTVDTSNFNYELSDNIATGEATSSEERQSTFTTMMKIALETACAQFVYALPIFFASAGCSITAP